MIDLLQTAKDIVKWADANSGFASNKWIIGNQNHGRPSFPYGVIIIRDIARLGHDYISPPDSGTGLRTATGNRDLTVELQTIGDAYGVAYTALAKLRDSSRLDTVRLALLDDGLAYIDDQVIVDITGLEDSEMIPRYSMDTKFRLASVQTGIDDGTIDSVIDMQGDLKIDQTIIETRIFSVNN